MVVFPLLAWTIGVLPVVVVVVRCQLTGRLAVTFSSQGKHGAEAGPSRFRIPCSIVSQNATMLLHLLCLPDALLYLLPLRHQHRPGLPGRPVEAEQRVLELAGVVQSLGPDQQGGGAGQAEHVLQWQCTLTFRDKIQ